MAISTLVVLIIALALTKQGFQTNTNENKEKSDTLMRQIEKYEYCIKIIMVCYLVLDTPPDYEDDYEDTEIDAKPFGNVEEEFRKSNCVPEDLPNNDLSIFWDVVQRWQQEVKEQLLITNIFSIKDELDNGNAIMINLWNIFKIRKFVICNRTNDFGDTKTTDFITSSTITTTTEPLLVQSEVDCDENQEIGIWINEQTKTAGDIGKLTKILPDILAKLELQINRNCCPYAILRARFETINDNVDTVMQLKALDVYERAKSTGSALLDVHNLMVRLEYLNQRTIKDNNATSKCCNNWNMQMKDAEYKLQMKKDYIQSIISTSSIYNSLTTFQKNFKLNFKNLEDWLLIKEDKYENVACCNIFGGDNNNISGLIHDIKRYDFKHDLSKDTSKRVMNSNSGIQNTQMLINIERNKTNNLISMCTEKCAHKLSNNNQEQINNLTLADLNKQVQQIRISMDSKYAAEKINLGYLNEIINDGYTKLRIIKTKIDSIKSQPLPENKSYSDENNKLVSNCLSRVEKLADLQKLIGLFDANMNSHNDIKSKAFDIVRELYDQLDEFIKKVGENRTIAEQTYNSLNRNKVNEHLSSLEQRFHEVLPIISNSRKSEDSQSQEIMNITNKLEVRFSEFSDYEYKKLIERKISDLENKLIATNFSPIENLMDNPEVNNKLDYLEAGFNYMTDQRKGIEKRMLDIISGLENLLRAVNEKIIRVQADTYKCNGVCDLGELPSIAELEGRVQAVQLKLKKNKSLH